MNGFAVALRRASSSIAILLILAGAGLLPSTVSHTGTTSQKAELVVTHAAPATRDATPWFDRAPGLVFRGLTPGEAGCRGSWALMGNPTLCTHGPDRARPGINVTRVRSTEEILSATDEGTAASTTSGASIPCYGDGVDGERVQVVYAHAADVPDRFNELAASLTQWVGNVDAAFNASAAETGGIRHVRWVTDGDCKLVIQRVQLTSTGDDSFSAIVGELGSVALSRPDRKYLIWTDASIYCGIATLYRDDSPGSLNRNNVSSGYGRIDSGCWGASKSVEAHELMHLLGGVQYTAPHTTGGGHCTDAYDRMCYTDSQSVQLTYSCASTTHAKLFDCNHDDYFSTNPSEGSYLATHWNTASSSFLESVDPPAWSSTTTTPTPTPLPPSPSPTPTTSPIPSPSPTTSPSTSPTSTSTLTGTLNRKSGAVTYTITVGTGNLEASLSFNKGSGLTLTLADQSGRTIATRSGGNPVSLTTLVSQGTYSMVVSGRGNPSFTLTVRYASP